MLPQRPRIVVSEAVTRQLTISRREIDSVVIGVIAAVGCYLSVRMTGFNPDFGTVQAMSAKFLGMSAPLFAAAGIFLLWVIGALVVEIGGLTDVRRRWDGVAAALFYLENAAPFVGLLECFISIVKALLAYSEAGASAAAQSVLISNIAVALCASAVGCFVALLAHSLKAVLTHRMSRS